MSSKIQINILHGSASVTDEDRERAEAASLKVFDAFEWRKGQPMQIDPAEAYEAYRRHMSDEEYNRSPRETLLIAAWTAAEKAADLALTEGWHDPNGAACSISVYEDSEMTLDHAQDAFRSHQCAQTAQCYLSTAIEYWEDEMIGDDTFAAAKKEIAAYLEATGQSITDPRTRAEWWPG